MRPRDPAVDEDPNQTTTSIPRSLESQRTARAAPTCTDLQILSAFLPRRRQLLSWAMEDRDDPALDKIKVVVAGTCGSIGVSASVRSG
jgi:hypothetical protein